MTFKPQALSLYLSALLILPVVGLSPATALSSENLAVSQSASALPEGLEPAWQTGERQIVILPLQPGDPSAVQERSGADPEWSGIQQAAVWLNQISGNRINFTVTDTLPALVVNGDCTDARNAGYYRWQQLQKTLPATTHVVAVAPFEFECRTGGYAVVSGTYAFVAAQRDGTVHAQTVVHELGHNLGLPHPETSECSLQGCVDFVHGYRDVTDPMSAGWLSGSFNATNLAYLGWSSDGVRNLPGRRTQTLRVPAMAIPGKPDAVAFTVGDQRFIVSYRKAVQDEHRDRGMTGESSGITVHVLSQDYVNRQHPNAVYPFTSLRPFVVGRGVYDPFGHRGDTWTDPGSGTRLKVLSTGKNFAKIRLKLTTS